MYLFIYSFKFILFYLLIYFFLQREHAPVRERGREGGKRERGRDTERERERERETDRENFKKDACSAQNPMWGLILSTVTL